MQPGSIVITESLAKKIFGDAASALDQTIYFNGDEPTKITGVIKDMPQNSHLHFSGIRTFNGFPFDNNSWRIHLYTYVLLRKGADVHAFEKKLNAFEHVDQLQKKWV